MREGPVALGTSPASAAKCMMTVNSFTHPVLQPADNEASFSPPRIPWSYRGLRDVSKTRPCYDSLDDPNTFHTFQPKCGHDTQERYLASTILVEFILRIIVHLLKE